MKDAVLRARRITPAPASRGDEVLLLNSAARSPTSSASIPRRVRQPMSVRRRSSACADRRTAPKRADADARRARRRRTAATVTRRARSAARRAAAAAGRPVPAVCDRTRPQSERIERGALPERRSGIGDVRRRARARHRSRRRARQRPGHARLRRARSARATGTRSTPSLLDWSLYHRRRQGGEDAPGAGSALGPAELLHAGSARRARSYAHLGSAAATTVAPGEYRAYLAPAALDELLWMLNWSGVSAKAQRTKQSCIQKLVDGEAALSPRLTDRARTSAGGTRAGVRRSRLRQARTQCALVRDGRHAGSMVVPRTGARIRHREPTAPARTRVDGGDGGRRRHAAPTTMSSTTLGTGLYVGNLLVPQLLAIAPTPPRDRHDALRHLLGRATDAIAAPRQRDALGRHAVPDARRQPRGTD